MFTDHYGIDTTRARRFRAREYDEGVVGICLNEKYAEVGRKVTRRDKDDDSSRDQGDDGPTKEVVNPVDEALGLTGTKLE